MEKSLRELRGLIYENGYTSPVVNGVIDESAFAAICDEILDEAYLGKTAVDPILNAMRAVCQKLEENPQEQMERTVENANLQEAIKKVFGFKSVTIRWENRGAMLMGAYTIPGNPVKYGKKPGFIYGQNANGFYDQTHSMPIFIEMSNDAYRDALLTPEEMTALMLHEIGHNFDFTAYTMFFGWARTICDIAGLFTPFTFVPAINDLIARTDPGRNIVHVITNIDVILMNNIPPLGRLGRGMNKLFSSFGKFFNALFSPAMAFTIPLKLLNAPMVSLITFFSRKKEVYADNFAASYGYAQELTNALAKLEASMTRVSIQPAGGLAELFYDFAQFCREFDTTFFSISGHGSTQQRMIRTKSKLMQDLKNNDVPPELRKELENQIAEMDSAYQQYLEADDYQMKNITAFFRNLVDHVYDGKDYMFIEPARDYDQPR